MLITNNIPRNRYIILGKACGIGHESAFQDAFDDAKQKVTHQLTLWHADSLKATHYIKKSDKFGAPVVYIYGNAIKVKQPYRKLYVSKSN